MKITELSGIYKNYISCLNEQDWRNLHQFVNDAVTYNGQRVGLAGYREMLVKDFEAIPDLQFNIDMLIAEPPRIASRLQFNCTPRGVLFGFNVDGKTVSFAENVFYEFVDGKIMNVWSVIDKVAIAAQIQGGSL